MALDIASYLDAVRAQYASGHATEHSYRPALHGLFKSIDPALNVINEPKKSEAGMPDFLFERSGVPFGWAEAKDIDKNVRKLEGYSIEQRRRYEKAYPHLIYTNGVDSSSSARATASISSRSRTIWDRSAVCSRGRKVTRNWSASFGCSRKRNRSQCDQPPSWPS